MSKVRGKLMVNYRDALEDHGAVRFVPSGCEIPSGWAVVELEQETPTPCCPACGDEGPFTFQPGILPHEDRYLCRACGHHGLVVRFNRGMKPKPHPMSAICGARISAGFGLSISCNRPLCHPGKHRFEWEG